MNFTVRAEGLLPASFFSKMTGAAFDRGSVDFAEEFKSAAPLLAQTHDLRLLVLMAKLHALNRDLNQSVQFVELISGLLDQQWDHVHPQAEDGDYAYRMACLQALDENAHMVLPLQHAPIATHARAGTITLRTILLQAGDIEPREGEKQIDAADFDRAMSEIELADLVNARDRFARLNDAVTAIRARWLERAGFEQAVRFDVVAPFAAKARDKIAAIVARRDPHAATGTGAPGATADGVDGQSASGGAHSANPGAEATAASGSVKTFTDAQNALSAAADYFARHEPSNPALLIIRQAQQLMGKTFLEVLRLLVPDHVNTAMINIGKDNYFQFPVERLEEFGSLPASEPSLGEPAVFVAASRQEAVRLLAQVNTFYATHEPSSPIPFFTERARTLAGQDFLGILKDVLPGDALKTIERNLT